MFEVHFSISDNILTMSLGSSFYFVAYDTSNFPPLVPIQEVSRTYFVSRYFIGRKDFRNIFSLFFAMHGQSISYREASPPPDAITNNFDDIDRGI
jgi:hypothetical protein